jgi:hypothetical protein
MTLRRSPHREPNDGKEHFRLQFACWQGCGDVVGCNYQGAVTMSMFAVALMIAGVSAPAASTDDVLRKYVACAAKRQDGQMRVMLNTKDEGEYRAAALAFASEPRCIRDDADYTAVLFATMNSDRGKLRGMVAESLLSRSKSVRQLPAVPQEKVYTANWFANSGRTRAVDEMAMCAAATNPVGVLTLLATKPGSDRQRSAFTGLTSTLGACLAKGYQLDTKPAGLRAALAEALYHRDYYAAVPGAGSAY